MQVNSIKSQVHKKLQSLERKLSLKNNLPLSVIQYDAQDIVNCLNTLTYKTKNGQNRHISRKSIESIINYLLYQKQEIISVDTES